MSHRTFPLTVRRLGGELSFRASNRWHKNLPFFSLPEECRPRRVRRQRPRPVESSSCARFGDQIAQVSEVRIGGYGFENKRSLSRPLFSFFPQKVFPQAFENRIEDFNISGRGKI